MVGRDLGTMDAGAQGRSPLRRGGADDGYAIFGSLTSIRALQEQGLPHSRCVVLIEACEESGSYDLPFYVDHRQSHRHCPPWSSAWIRAAQLRPAVVHDSLRGLAGGNLRVNVLTEGVHSV